VGKKRGGGREAILEEGVGNASGLVSVGITLRRKIREGKARTKAQKGRAVGFLKEYIQLLHLPIKDYFNISLGQKRKSDRRTPGRWRLVKRKSSCIEWARGLYPGSQKERSITLGLVEIWA